MRRRHLCPFRVGPTCTCAIELLKLLDVDQFDRRRILIVLDGRLVLIVPLSDAQEARFTVAADNHGAARTEVNGTGAVHDNIQLGRTRHKKICRRQAKADAVLTALLRQFLIEIPMAKAHICQNTLCIGLNISAHMVDVQELLFKGLNGEIQRN